MAALADEEWYGLSWNHWVFIGVITVREYEISRVSHLQLVLRPTFHLTLRLNPAGLGMSGAALGHCRPSLGLPQLASLHSRHVFHILITCSSHDCESLVRRALTPATLNSRVFVRRMRSAVPRTLPAITGGSNELRASISACAALFTSKCSFVNFMSTFPRVRPDVVILQPHAQIR